MTYKVKISSKGQMTIPADIRRELGLHSVGTATVEDGKLVVKRQPTAEDLHKILGVDKNPPKYVPKKMWRKSVEDGVLESYRLKKQRIDNDC